MRQVLPLSIVAALLLVLVSCAGQQSRPADLVADSLAAPEAAGQSLPSPAQTGKLARPAELAPLLPKVQRQGSYAAADLIRAGDQFEAALPHQNTLATAGAASMAGTFGQPGSPGASGLAFAIYRFTIPDYLGNAQLTYDFSTAPATLSDAYFGFANWGKDRWDWFEADASGNAEPASLAPYFLPDGTLLVVALLSGSNNASLASLRIGSQAPVVQLTSTTRSGLTPLTVDFSAAGSTDPDGTIAQYRWDPEGDGIFEISTGTNPEFSHEYAAAGSFNATVRVFDNQGVASDAQLEISAVNSAVLSYGSGDAGEIAAKVIVCDDGHLMLLGTRSTSGGSDVLVAKLSPTGTADFTRLVATAEDDFISDAQLASDGFIYAVGSTQTAGKPDGLLQKWSQSGELIFSLSIGGAEDSESFSRLGTLDGSIYITGTYVLHNLDKNLGITARLDTSGNPVWFRSLVSAGDCRFNALTVVPPSASSDGGVALCGSLEDAGADIDALYVLLNFNGSRLSDLTLGGGLTNESATGIAVTDTDPPFTYVCGRYLGIGGESFVSRLDLGTVGLTLDGTEGAYASGMALLDGSPVLTCEWLSSSFKLSYLAVGLDANLIQNSSLFVIPGTETDLYPQDLAGYGSGNIAGCGSLSGALPTDTGPLTLSATPVALNWGDASVTSGSPNTLVVTALSTATIEPTGYQFNRGGADTDFCLVLGQLQ